MVRDRRGFVSFREWLVLLIGAAVFLAVYAFAFAPARPDPYSAPIAEHGDFVEVDYIGTFLASGLVFDTSVEEAATDNASWPKALSFRPRTAGYSPLGFTMGCETGADCPLAAFQDGVRGLRVGDTAVLRLSPEQAYGVSDVAKIETRELLEEIPATQTMDKDEFQSRYITNPVDGVVVRDPVWTWNATVTVSGQQVFVRAQPDLGKVVRVAQKWDAEVVAVDDTANSGEGVVVVRHHLSPSDVRTFVAHDFRGDFILTGIDSELGTFTVDYNAEIVGADLVFEVTLTALRKGNP